MTKKPIREVLATNIRYYMREVPSVDTQVKLAKKAGISQSSVARVLAGRIDTQISIVAAIANAFGVNAADLLKEDVQADIKPVLDLKRFATLPKSEQEKIRSFADFIFSQAPTAAADERAGAADFEAEVKPTIDQRDRAKRVARRPLSNESLSLTPHEKREKRDQGKHK